MKRNHGLDTFKSNGFGIKKPKLIGGDSKVNSRYETLQEQRRSLPIFPARRKLIQELIQAQSAIVIGETGSGKTTQIPQYIYEAGLHRNHIIACTQPRRVAAITVAQRVSEERGRSVGELVGYNVRFEDVTSAETKIKYMTDGMLLREAILDPLLKKYSVILLDEAHERTIHTDVLFGVIKSAQKRRRKTHMPLKIIVMSATMDVDHFSEYFNRAPVLYLEGRQYPVKVMYIQEPPSDYAYTTLVTIFQIHQEMPANEDLLVFMTGQEEIESLVRSIREISRVLPSDCPRVFVYPLYAALPPAVQLRVFQKTPPNARKIIVSTNIAETSVTIHGIKYVIDTGLVKAKTFNAGTGVDILKVQQISKAQAWQRTGRAGRECPGISYRLYTEAQYEAMQENTVPEIQRCNMSSVTLQLLAMGVPDVATFDFMDKPTDKSILAALTQLELLGAIEMKEGQPQLTNLGRQMAAFPLDPQLAKAIIVASQESCLEEVLTIVSLMSVDSIVHTPQSKRDAALDARKKFISPEGDHITMLNIYRGYRSVNGNKEWCHENFIHATNIKTVLDIRQQLRDICVAQKLMFKSCGRDFTSVRKSLATGLFMNSAELQKEGEYVTLSTRKVVSIHPSSALFRCRPACVIFNELVQTSKSYMKSISLVDPEWLYDIAPNYFRRKKPGKVQ